ncbi:MAG TPA: retropepsin-like aspartic protease [Candidatus Baltobacteraceae bacterium]|nr:retropepsin-like aspartic protease [Candidatus Baltobacteraceae bacterium]
MKRLYVGLFAILAVLSTHAGATAAEQQPDAKAQALLQKHRAYVGWQFGDGTFRTMRIASTVTNKKGEKLEDVSWASSGLAFHETRTNVKEDNVTTHQGFTGSIFWQCFTSGFTTPLYGEAAKALAAYTMLTQEGTSGLPGVFRGDKTVDGKDVALVRVGMENGDPIDLYIDPATGAYVKAVIDPDGAYESTYHILSYADVAPGKKAIGSYRIGDSDELHTNVKFEPNATVSNDDLHPPKPTAAWSFVSDQPAPIRLTYDRILIDATVNGVKGTFIFDTGSDAIRLDDRFADRAKVEVLKGNNDVSSVYDTVKERVRSVSEMTFGSASLQNVLVYSQDFERWGYQGLDAKGYAGLIGSDFLAGAIVKLDVYNSKMTILDPNTDLSDLKMLPVIADLSDGLLTVPMTLDKTLDVNAVLDTGNPGSILFAYDLVKKHHPFHPQVLTLGPIQYAVGSWEGCCFAANYALLGFDFLKHFDYVFDYPHGRIFLTPNKN